MRNNTIILLLLLILGCKASDETKDIKQERNPAQLLIDQVIQSMGGIEAYHKLKNVEYHYYYQTEGGDKKDVSIERYIYNGEKSWARYLERNLIMLPDIKGEIVQGYDGNKAWATIDGVLSTDPKIIGNANFMRKTNFYWFNMMFKLSDEGTILKLKESKGDTDYELVELSFENNVGDVQDIYLLYINKQTKLIDKFLFTVMDFNISDPLLMELRYEEIEGMKWPTYRRYTKSDWEGSIPEEAEWTEEISKDLRFNIEMDPALFVAN